MTREQAINSMISHGFTVEQAGEIIKAVTLQEPTTKNDLGVDCISRKAAEDITWQDPSYTDPLNILTEVRDKIRELPSVTPQLSVPEVTALAEWIEKLTKECEDAYNKGYADGVKAQEPILDKIYADIQKLRGCSCSCSDGIVDDVEEILDKYKAETEE